MKKKISFVLLLVLFVYSCYLIYISSFQKLIYKKNDFISSQISSTKDYEIAEFCVQTYLNTAHNDTANIKYFLRNNDRKRHIKYNKVLNESYVSIVIKDVKKSIDNVYIVYYKLNAKSEDVRRIALRKNVIFNTYQIISDSMYESLEV